MIDEKKKTKTIKTAEYTRRAINNYRKDKKIITITLPMSDYELLKARGIVTAADVRKVLLDILK